MKKLAVLVLMILAVPVVVLAEENNNILAEDILSEITSQIESRLEQLLEVPAAYYEPTPALEQGTPSGLVNLNQQFDMVLGLYEISFPDGLSFLANVPNSGRTQDEVTLTLPANIRIDATLNGVPFRYVSGHPLGETGDYIFRITAPNIYGPGESTAIFRFRILPPTGPVTTEEFFAFSSNGGSDTLEYVFSNHRRFTANVADGETVPGPVTINVPAPLVQTFSHDGEGIRLENNRPIREPGEYVLRVIAPPFSHSASRATALTTTLTFTIAEQAPPEPPPIVQLPGVVGGLVNDFLPDQQTGIADMLPPFGFTDPDAAEDIAEELSPPETALLPDLLSVMQVEGSEYFNVFFSNGSSFLSSIEMGIVAEEPVFFEIPEWFEYELLSGGLPVEYSSGSQIDTPGVYVLRVTLPAAEGEPWQYFGEFAFAVGEGVGAEPELETIPAITAPVGMNLPTQVFSAPNFIHYVTNELLFSTTAANGETLTDPVSFNVLTALNPVLTVNGEELPFNGDETVTQPGEYLLTVTNPINGEIFHFFFVILPGALPAPVDITPPLDYAIVSITLNGTPYLHLGGGTASLSTEGEFAVTMSAPDFPNFPERILYLTLDFTPPVITLEEADREVTISVDDYTAEVVLFLYDEAIPLQWTVTAPGNYRVTATDPAGNITEAEFSIPYRMNMTAILFIVLVVLLLGGGAFYFFRIHKHVKV